MARKKTIRKKRRRKNPKTSKDAAPQEARRFLGSNTSIFAWVLGTSVLLFLLLLVYITSQPLPSPETYSYQEPLIPLTSLRVLPEETYAYVLRSPGMADIPITNHVKERKGRCMVIITMSQNMTFPFCLDVETGDSLTSSGDPAPSPEFSQPWMLALKEGWTWKVSSNTTVEMMGMRETMHGSSEYRVAAIGSMKGRSAYKVIIETTITRINDGDNYESSKRTEVIWVDTEKLVMIYGTSGESVLELIDAPFDLEQVSYVE
ncbi:MAG: hypothetical protein ABIG39_01935 [Candidatus Micrarchaeota archaeon]